MAGVFLVLRHVLKIQWHIKSSNWLPAATDKEQHFKKWNDYLKSFKMYQNFPNAVCFTFLNSQKLYIKKKKQSSK